MREASILKSVVMLRTKISINIATGPQDGGDGMIAWTSWLGIIADKQPPIAFRSGATCSESLR
jgi:hypothetical protein